MAGAPKRAAAARGRKAARQEPPVPPDEVLPEDEEDGEEAAAARERVAAAAETRLGADGMPVGLSEKAREVWRRALSDRVWRIALARKSIPFFAWAYLRQRGRPVAVPACHVAWYDAIGTGASYRQRDKATGEYAQRRTLLLAPRSHGKSFVSAWVVPLHRICTNHNVRILMLGPNTAAAVKRVRRIRQQLESNKALIADFAPSGGFRDPHAPWTDHYFQVRRTDASLADPTVEACGAGGNITGARFDLIIADDPESDKSTLTAESRKKSRDWFRGTIMELLEPWGEAVAVGTRKHHDDLYAALLKDKTFRTNPPETQKAISGTWPEWEWILDADRKIIGVDLKRTDGTRVLWPEVWPLKALLLKRESMTSILFARENQNEVTDDEHAAFKQAWFDAAMDGPAHAPGTGRGSRAVPWRSSEDVPPDWQVIIGLDPAFVDDPKRASDADSDYFVAAVVAVSTVNWHRRLLGGFRLRGLTPVQFERQIKALCGRYAAPSEHHPEGALRFVVVERNSLGKMYEYGLRKDTDLPLVPHDTRVSKFSPFEKGIVAIAALLENGMYTFPMLGATTAEIEFYESVRAEFTGLGVEAHDDTVSAVTLAEVAVRRFKDWWQRMEKGGRPSAARKKGGGIQTAFKKAQEAKAAAKVPAAAPALELDDDEDEAPPERPHSAAAAAAGIANRPVMAAASAGAMRDPPRPTGGARPSASGRPAGRVR